MNFTLLTPLLSSRFVSPKFIHFVLIGIVSIISFSSCAQKAGKILPQKETSVFFFDTRKYADQDFFITPFEYGGEHAVLGEIIVIASEGIMTQQDPKWKSVEKFVVLKDEISHVAVIDSLVTRAKEIGADGLIGFRTSTDYKDVEIVAPLSMPSLYPQEIFTARAWAIRRSGYK